MNGMPALWLVLLEALLCVVATFGPRFIVQAAEQDFGVTVHTASLIKPTVSDDVLRVDESAAEIEGQCAKAPEEVLSSRQNEGTSEQSQF